MVLSNDQVTTRSPSAVNATEVTGPLCPSRICFLRPVAWSQTSTSPSKSRPRASTRLSGENAREHTMSWARNMRKHTPNDTFHTLMVRSNEYEARDLLLGENVTTFAEFWCPRSVVQTLSACRSQTRIEPSSRPSARRLPSAENAAEQAKLFVSSVPKQQDSFNAQNLMVLSNEYEIRRPGRAAVVAMALTDPSWPLSTRRHLPVSTSHVFRSKEPETRSWPSVENETAWTAPSSCKVRKHDPVVELHIFIVSSDEPVATRFPSGDSPIVLIGPSWPSLEA